LVEAWRRERVSMVSSNALIIDRAGNPRQPIAKEAPARRIPPTEIVANVWLWPMLGATIAFEPDVVRSFAPLGERLAAGLDHVLPLRAAAMKGFYYLDEPLVLYRRHGGNMSNFVVDRAAGSRAAFQETDIAFQLTLHMQWYDDIGALCSARPEDAALSELRLRLSDRLQSELRYWCRLRAALRAEGKLPTWIDEADMLARPLTFHMAMDREILAEAAESESSAGAPSAARGTG
jgi:hypothetical protein